VDICTDLRLASKLSVRTFWLIVAVSGTESCFVHSLQTSMYERAPTSLHFHQLSTVVVLLLNNVVFTRFSKRPALAGVF